VIILKRFAATITILAGLPWYCSAAQRSNPDQVLAYPVPDALSMQDGKPVQNAEAWYSQRRGEILNLFAGQVYGRTPPGKPYLRSKVDSENTSALGGKALEKQVTLYFSKGAYGPRMHLLLYLPANAKGPVPVFVGLNFEGNQTVEADPTIPLNDVWVKAPKAGNANGITELTKHVRQRAKEQSRGKYAYRWQIEKILSNGYALATAYYGDVEPDFNGGLQFGVRSLYLKKRPNQASPGRMGSAERLGLGAQPRCRLPRDRPRYRC
jgi:hypothetical protein